MGVAAGLDLHGRMEVVEGDPSVVLDAAHNPAGAAALAEALPAVAGGRPVVAALALLADKDAAGLSGRWRRRSPGSWRRRSRHERLVEVGRPGARALGGLRLAELAHEAGVGWVEEVADPAEAVERARSVARAQGGVALVAGSHYLLRYAKYE